MAVSLPFRLFSLLCHSFPPLRSLVFWLLLHLLFVPVYICLPPCDVWVGILVVLYTPFGHGCCPGSIIVALLLMYICCVEGAVALDTAYTVKNNFWETSDHPDPAGSLSWHSWIKIHPQPDSYPVLAGLFSDFLTDNAIIKRRKIYIVGHFFSPSLQGWIFILHFVDIYPLEKYPRNAG